MYGFSDAHNKMFREIPNFSKLLFSDRNFGLNRPTLPADGQVESNI